jgi:glycosyltransferase involved in cell wall biosynthesis
MWGGGVQRSFIKLAQGLLDKGVEVDLVLVRAAGPFMEEVPSRVRLFDLQAGRALWAPIGLVKYLKRETPDVLLSGLSYINIIAIFAKMIAGGPTRVFVSERNTFSASRKGWTAGILSLLIRSLYNRAAGIFAVSEGVADDLAQSTGLARSRIDVIYNPIVTPELKTRAHAPIRHPWFREGQDPVVLAIGRLARQKDFQTLIRAFKLVSDQLPATKLVVLGEGQDRTALLKLVNELGLREKVDLPGFADNPYPYLAHASVFVLSSIYEGLPGVLIEALYFGIPLVATDCPSGPREILSNGRYGRLVPVGDPERMAEAILAALAGPDPLPDPAAWLPFECGQITDQVLARIGGAHA